MIRAVLIKRNTQHVDKHLEVMMEDKTHKNS